MKTNRIAYLIATTTVLIPTLSPTLIADEVSSGYIEQLRIDAQEVVNESCDIEAKQKFEWLTYTKLQQEELILLSIIDSVQNNTSNFCIPPDASKMASSIDRCSSTNCQSGTPVKPL